MKTLSLEEQRAIYAASTELDENGNKIYAKPVKAAPSYGDSNDSWESRGRVGNGLAVHSASTR